MPRRPAVARKVSLYRLVEPADGTLRDCIEPGYLEDDSLELTEVRVDTIKCLLVHVVREDQPIKWRPHLVSLTGASLKLANSYSSAVLLVPLHGHVYALCWGSVSRHLLHPGLLDAGFGLRFAIRRANPDHVRSLTRHTMDTLARTTSTSVPAGAELNVFGLEEVGELVSRLVGPISADGLTAARDRVDVEVTVRGADGLNVPLALRPTPLLSDLRLVHGVVEHQQPVKGLAHFEQTRPLAPRHPQLERLRTEFAAALEPGAPGRIALSWPTAWEDSPEASRYRLTSLARRSWDFEVDELELDHLRAPLAAVPLEQRLAALKRIRIQGFDQDGSPASPEIPGPQWLVFEADIDGQAYVYFQGRWFDIGGAYLEMLRTQAEACLSHRSTLRLPPWGTETKSKGKQPIGPAVEGAYNRSVPGRDARFLCLDKKAVKSDQHPRGFEACDLLGPDNELIHVKRLGNSKSASHLFAQAQVSAEALHFEASARADLQRVVREASNGQRSLPSGWRLKRVVLAFGGRKASASELFTFSQVTLVRCARRLAGLELDLEVVAIEDTDQLIPVTPPSPSGGDTGE